MGRVPSETTAFANRTSPYIVNCIARTPQAADLSPHASWARAARDAMSPFGNNGMYVNFTPRGERGHRAPLLPGRHLPPTADRQGPPRPRQPVPVQPEHQTVRAGMKRRPVLFVVDRDQHSLKVLLAGLSRRFGNDFTVAGDSSPATALAALQSMEASDAPVAAGARRRRRRRVSRPCPPPPPRGEAGAPRRSRLHLDEPGGTGHDARLGRLPHRQAMARRRDDARRHELNT